MKESVVTKQLIKGLGSKQNIERMESKEFTLSVIVSEISKVNLETLQSLTEVDKIELANHTFTIELTQEAQTIVNEMNEIVAVEEAEESVEETKKKSIGTAIIGAISGIFSPILAALAGAGILQGITILLTEFGIVMEGTFEHTVLATVSDAVFFFLPMLLAFSTAKVFGANPYLSVVLAGILLHPDMVSMMTNNESIPFFGLTIRSARYPNSVIPIILIVWAQSYLEKAIKRFVPKSLNMIVAPILVLLIGSIIGLVFLGPLGTIIGDGMAAFIGVLNNYVPWLVPIVMGALAPFIIMAGIHYSLFPVVTLSLAQLGYDNVMIPGMLASNLALAGVSVAVALKTKRGQYKSYAFSSALTASMGVSQPAIYGIGLLLKKPLYAGIIGGAVGGIYAGIVDLKAFAFANPGLAALPVFINEGNNLMHAVITMVIAFVVGFAATWFLGFEEPTEEEMAKGIQGQ